MLAMPLGLFYRALRVRPAAGTPPVSRADVEAAILVLADEQRPWIIERASAGSRADFIAEWRLADARWWTFLQRNGLAFTYRAAIRLDEGMHEVRVFET